MHFLHALPIAILGIVGTAGALDGAKGYDPAMNAACKGFLKGTFKCVSPDPSNPTLTPHFHMRAYISNSLPVWLTIP